jgi:hypothetical protein
MVGAVRVLAGILPDYYDGQQRLRTELTRLFESHAGSAAAATVRFLVAMDILLARGLSEQELEILPRTLREYLVTYRQRARDRAALIHRLQQMGMTVVTVPGLADEEASINPINGIQTPTSYLMPAWGAPYASLDEAAKLALSEAFGDGVQIVPIRSAALQAAYGGPHCAASVYPRAR